MEQPCFSLLLYLLVQCLVADVPCLLFIVSLYDLENTALTDSTQNDTSASAGTHTFCTCAPVAGAPEEQLRGRVGESDVRRTSGFVSGML